MTSIYGPTDWNAQENAKDSLECLDPETVIARGEKLWAKLGEQP